MVRGFHKREESCFHFLCNPLFCYLVRHIFLVRNKKNELNFFVREDFDFSCGNRDGRIAWLPIWFFFFLACLRARLCNKWKIGFTKLLIFLEKKKKKIKKITLPISPIGKESVASGLTPNARDANDLIWVRNHSVSQPDPFYQRIHLDLDSILCKNLPHSSDSVSNR